VQRYEPLIDIVAVAFQLYVMQGVTWKVYRKSIVRSVIISFENEQDFEIRVSCAFRKHMARMQEIMLEGGYVISTTPEDRDLIDRVITFFESPFTGVSYEIMPRMSDPTATCLQTRVNCTDSEPGTPICNMVWFREGIQENVYARDILSANGRGNDTAYLKRVQHKIVTEFDDRLDDKVVHGLANDEKDICQKSRCDDSLSRSRRVPSLRRPLIGKRYDMNAVAV
jgi:hypothetical protein